MRTFADKTGRQWTIELTIGDVERLLATSPFNLYEPAQPIATRPEPQLDPQRSLLERLTTSWPLFWELLCHLCGPQIEAATLTAADFGRAMAGECLFKARQMFWEEWADFFRSLQNEPYAALLEMEVQFLRATIEETRAKANDPRIHAAMQRAIQTLKQGLEKDLQKDLDMYATSAIDSGPGSLPAPSASTPDPSASGS